MLNIRVIPRFLAVFLFCATAAYAQEGMQKKAAENGFVISPLDPIGGKIKRPHDWHYRENHIGTSYSWTFARENGGGEPYTTGVRIQAFPYVKKSTGEGGKEFIYSFIIEKRKMATRVLKICPDWKDGAFTRTCLETEEGPKHYLYSLAWGGNKDMVIISIASTDKNLWSQYEAMFETMGKFEISDIPSRGK